MLLQPVEVAVHGPGLTGGPFDAYKLFMVDDTPALHGSQFLVETMVDTGTRA
jgi:hypothetical protein